MREVEEGRSGKSDRSVRSDRAVATEVVVRGERASRWGSEEGCSGEQAAPEVATSVMTSPAVCELQLWNKLVC